MRSMASVVPIHGEKGLLVLVVCARWHPLRHGLPQLPLGRWSFKVTAELSLSPFTVICYRARTVMLIPHNG